MELKDIAYTEWHLENALFCSVLSLGGETEAVSVRWANWHFLIVVACGCLALSFYIIEHVYHLCHTYGTLYFDYNNTERMVINIDYETKIHQFKQS